MDSMFVQDGPICEQALDHVHSDECVLVYGYSSAVDLFLKAAGRESKFQVLKTAAVFATLAGNTIIRVHHLHTFYDVR